MGLIATKQAQVAALEAANAAILSEVQALTAAGETSETNSTIAAYVSRLAEITSLNLEINDLQAEADTLAPLCAADASDEATVLADVETKWSAFAVSLGSAIKLSREGGRRANRHRELTGLATYARPQTDPSEDSEAFGDIERSVQSTLDETGDIVRVTMTIPAQVL